MVSRISAMPLMPIPPMPMKWIRCERANRKCPGRNILSQSTSASLNRSQLRGQATYLSEHMQGYAYGKIRRSVTSTKNARKTCREWPYACHILRSSEIQIRSKCSCPESTEFRKIRPQIHLPSLQNFLGLFPFDLRNKFRESLRPGSRRWPTLRNEEINP